VLKGKSPYEMLHKEQPDLKYVRTFGCLCYPNLGDIVPNKLSKRTLPYVLLGLSQQHKGHRCFYPPSGKVYISRHVIFNEIIFSCIYLCKTSNNKEFFDVNKFQNFISNLPILGESPQSIESIL
jgi:hypothetical protein